MTTPRTKNGTALRGWLRLAITVIVLVVAVAVDYATVAARVSENCRNITEYKRVQNESLVLLREIDVRTSVIEQIVKDLKDKDGRTAAATKEMKP